MKPNKHKMRSEGYPTTWPNLFRILLRQSEDFSNFCKVLSRFAFRNMIVPLPKHVIQRALKLPSISHTCFFDTTKLYKPLPLFAVFCVFEVAQCPHENNMSGANTKSVLARFGDTNWKKGGGGIL